MKRILYIGTLLLFLSACDQQKQKDKKQEKYAAQIKQVERLLHYASTCDSLGVQKMFGDTFEDIGQYENNINSAVLKLYLLIKKHGTPDPESFKYNTYGEKHPRLVDIVISFPPKNKFLVEFLKHQPVEVFNFTEVPILIAPTKN